MRHTQNNMAVLDKKMVCLCIWCITFKFSGQVVVAMLYTKRKKYVACSFDFTQYIKVWEETCQGVCFGAIAWWCQKKGKYDWSDHSHRNIFPFWSSSIFSKCICFSNFISLLKTYMFVSTHWLIKWMDGLVLSFCW